MTEAIIATFDDVKFIEGVTKMTQSNWQGYFGSVIPDGVYSGLEFQQINNSYSSYYHLTDGVAFVNGLMAVLKTNDGYTDIGRWYATSEKDAFFCLRIYLKDQKAEVIKKVGILDTITEQATNEPTKFMWALGKFLANEAYQCDRDELIWDVPLIYFGYNLLNYGRDLRRMVKPNGKPEINPRNPNLFSNRSSLVSSNNVYTATADATYYLDTVNFPNEAIILNDSESQISVKLCLNQYLNDFYTNYDINEQAYAETYTYNRGVTYHKLYISDDLTYSSYTDTTDWQNRYESITLPAKQALHISFLGTDEVATGVYAYKFLVG